VTTVPARLLTHLVVCCLAFTPQPVLGRTPANRVESATTVPQVAGPRDGQHDFDFEFGEWKAKLTRLQQPLTGSTTWIEYEGTSVVRKIWDGRANLGSSR